MKPDILYLPVSIHPPTILTPPIYQDPPTNKARRLIKAAVKRICAADTTYLVRFSVRSVV
jgi:hypothetical protein